MLWLYNFDRFREGLHSGMDIYEMGLNEIKQGPNVTKKSRVVSSGTER